MGLLVRGCSGPAQGRTVLRAMGQVMPPPCWFLPCGLTRELLYFAAFICDPAVTLEACGGSGFGWGSVLLSQDYMPGVFKWPVILRSASGRFHPAISKIRGQEVTKAGDAVSRGGGGRALVPRTEPLVMRAHVSFPEA